MTPSYKLDIGHPGNVSQVRVQGGWDDNLNSNSRMIFNDYNFGIGAGQYGSGSAEDALNLWSFNGANRGILFSSASNGGTTTFENMQHNMFIEGSSGNVGIGTTNPEARLHVEKGATSSNSRTAPIDQIYLTSSHPSTGYDGFGTSIVDFRRTYQNATQHAVNRINFIERGHSSADRGGAITFDTKTLSSGTAAPVERMRIDYDGNVGIGVTDPVQRLHVAGQVAINDNDTRIFEGSNNAIRHQTNSGYIDIGAQNTSHAHIYSDRPSFYFNQPAYVGSGNVLLNSSSGNSYINAGNLGLGTTGPTQKLDVEGQVRIRGGSPADGKVLMSTSTDGTATWSNSPTLKPATSTFTVDGSFSEYYPVTFLDASWNDGPMELEIVRSSVHTNSSWRGSLQSRFFCHATNYGHGSEFVDAQIYYGSNTFIAGYDFHPRGREFIVWLRGGGTTYTMRTNNLTTVTDYAATAKSLSIYTYPVKTTIDSYVQSYGRKFQGTIGSTSLAGTGDRPVHADANGNLVAGSANANVATYEQRAAVYMNNANSGYRVAGGSTNNLTVQTGDKVIVMITHKFWWTGGSGGDHERYGMRVTGDCGTIDQYETYKNGTSDDVPRNQEQSLSHQFIWTATCNGNVQFSLLCDNNSGADDNSYLGDIVVVATRH